MSTATLQFHVTDDRGEPSPFRLEWRDESTLGGRWQRQCSDSGLLSVQASAGKVQVLVRRGINYDAVAMELVASPGETICRDVTLRQRFDPKAMGWWGGESHMHVLHGPKDPPVTIADGARIAAADGLDYVQLAYAWDASMGWPSAGELNRQCRAATTSHVVVGWNVECPKSYMTTDDGGRAGNVHGFGHGWTVGLNDIGRGKDFFHSGPNFRVMQEVQRQGGIVGCAHPVRFWFHPTSGNFVSNWASELPFDFVAGVPYAAVDILNDSPLLFFESERFWYTLLNLGYKVAGTGNTDGAVGTTRQIGRYRTYARVEGDFTWEKLAASIKGGQVIATSGPFIQFAVDGRPSGAEFPADGRPRRATLQAWSGPLPGETLSVIQLVRNGEVIRAWDLRNLNAREWAAEFELSDSEFAWYCVRVLSTSRDPISQQLWGPHLCELAVANPVYFLPEGFCRPAPEPARVLVRVVDDAGTAVAATVAVHDGAEVIAEQRTSGDGSAQLTVPATASLRISADGLEPAERTLFLDCPELLEFARSAGGVYPSFYSPETYHEIRHRLGRLKLNVTLHRQRG